MFVEFESPYPESWCAVVVHQESTLETTAVEGCVFYELTFSWKMPNTVTAEKMKISMLWPKVTSSACWPSAGSAPASVSADPRISARSSLRAVSTSSRNFSPRGGALETGRLKLGAS